MISLEYGIFLLTSAAVIFSFLAFLIFSRNNFTKSNVHKGIAVLLLTLSLRFFTIHLQLNHLMIEYPHFLLVNNLTSRIGMPILYFVILSSLYSWKFKWFDALHLILPVLFVIHFSNVYFGSLSYKIELINEMDRFGFEIVWQKGFLIRPI